jgi:hypothetical protein
LRYGFALRFCAATATAVVIASTPCEVGILAYSFVMQHADGSPAFLRKRLRRLDRSFYRGHCYVHWTISMQNRATGWLDEAHHLGVRHLLLHTLSRYFLCCPVYCLMPDHGHFLFVGLEARADQLAALSWFRREWNRLLRPVKQQDQA